MSDQPALRATVPVVRLDLPARLGLLGALLVAEKIALSTLVDTRRARDAEGFGAFLHIAQHWGFRYLVTFVAAVSVLSFVKAKNTQGPAEAILPLSDVSFRWMLIHGLLLAALAPLSYFLFRGDVTTIGLAAIAGLWLIASATAIFAAGLGLIPVNIWLRGIRSIGIGWIYAATAALLGTGAWLESEKLWNSATAITFRMVTWILMPVLHLSYVDPATRIIAAPHFAVEITQVCSGMEGLGLTMAFSMMWLAYFRHEYIFPRALILIPLSLLAIFCLNASRIAALLLIGNAGYPDVASFGFHSQAGWIAFNLVACALVYFSRRSRWLNRTANVRPEAKETQNPTAVYLMPLLSILAAGVVSHALSGRFETFYPLRFIAGFAVLTIYRRDLLKIDWEFSWRGPAIGMGVFVLWMASAQAILPASGFPDALASFSPIARGIWIAGRLLACILTAPVVEELAYRGYLMRRLGHSDFELVPFKAVRWPALAISSIAFGMAHGALWLPAIVTGWIYGILVIRSGRLGESLAAHMTTNGLIAVVVLTHNQWQLW